MYGWFSSSHGLYLVGDCMFGAYCGIKMTVSLSAAERGKDSLEGFCYFSIACT